MIPRRFLGALIVAMVTLSTPAAAKQNYSPAKVIEAMKANNHNLRIIVEHRGSFSQDCPENSICAINATGNAGIEAVEIDVRESADGTLWPIHDTRVGRTTNFAANGHLFDPYVRSERNTQSNPEISKLRDATLEKLRLRDPLGNVSRYSFQRLENMMRDVDIGNRNLVYMFDIKTSSAIGKTASMIRRMGLQDRSILKFNSTLVSPRNLLAETQGLHFVPVMGTGSLDQIADHFHLERSSPSERVNAYVHDLSRTRGFVYFEVRNKMFSGPTSNNDFDAKVEGPLNQVNFYMRLTGITQGGFRPSPEHFSTPNQPGSGYYFVDGQCCQQLAQHHDTSRHFGTDTRDDRENLHYMISYNAVIISEKGSQALAKARAMGARKEQHRLLY